MSSDLLVLTAADVDEVLRSTPVDDLVTLMGRVFSRLTSNADAVVCPQRLTVPTTSHNALFMPAGITPFGTAMKVVSVPTTMGDTRGLPASTLVLDEETGAVRALLNASALTAYRTAAGVYLPSLPFLRNAKYTLCSSLTYRLRPGYSLAPRRTRHGQTKLDTRLRRWQTD